jgi:poly-gamma-glutamate capsule biosynthesis protein CapA/YwtB (metallophosphatase superfamily)
MKSVPAVAAVAVLAVSSVIILSVRFSGAQSPLVSPVGLPTGISVRPLPTEIPQSGWTPLPATPGSILADHSWISTVSSDRVRRLVATGDVIPARSVNSQTVARDDFLWPWREIAPVVSDADLTLVNLEAPLVEGCPATQSGMVFCGSPKHLEGLTAAGVDVANLANNHAGNYGQKGIDETVGILQTAGIGVCGLGEPSVRAVRGMRFSFLGFNDIGHAPEPIASAAASRIAAEIGAARGNADIVVVSFHWGTEYTSTPSARQRQLARVAVDSGADLVIGNHPHWVQPAETYRGKWITYAHGNTVFDQMWSEETRLGVIGIYTFIDRTLADVEFIPLKISGYGQAAIVPENREMMLRLLSRPLDRIAADPVQ